MGGERETLVEKEKSEVKVPKGRNEKAKIGTFRIHQSKGEVHIHDDENKLKVAIPVVEWWKMWNKLRNESGVWPYGDPDNKTKIVIQSVVDESGMDVTITVTPCTFSDSWQKLDTFSKRK